MKYELELELKFNTYSFTYHALSPAITKPHLLVSTVDIKCSSLVSASVSRPSRTPRACGGGTTGWEKMNNVLILQQPPSACLGLLGRGIGSLVARE